MSEEQQPYTPEQRSPWLKPTTREDLLAALGRTHDELRFTRTDGSEGIAVAVVGQNLRTRDDTLIPLRRLVYTVLGYIEIGPEFDNATIGERALEGLAVIDRDIARKDLDRGNAPDVLLSKRLKEEQAAQDKAGSAAFQTLDPLTEKVIVSWLREQGDMADEDAVIETFYDAAARIENGEYRRE